MGMRYVCDRCGKDAQAEGGAFGGRLLVSDFADGRERSLSVLVNFTAPNCGARMDLCHKCKAQLLERFIAETRHVWFKPTHGEEVQKLIAAAGTIKVVEPDPRD